jgi:hypothetical protein
MRHLPSSGRNGLWLFLCLHLAGFAQQPQLPPNYPRGQYDESRVPHYTLPDPLVLLNGKRVTSVKTWQKKRRPEILGLFATSVYGRTGVGRPKEMTWEVTARGDDAADGATSKTVAIYFAGHKDGPRMDLHIYLPAKAKKPAPFFIMPTGFRNIPKPVLDRGYGFASFDPTQIEPDRASGYSSGIRAFFASPAQKQPGADQWGAIGAWAWGMSRAMDYLVTDADVDPSQVSAVGVSRYGKVCHVGGGAGRTIRHRFLGRIRLRGCDHRSPAVRGDGEIDYGIRPLLVCRQLQKLRRPHE